MYIKFEDLLLSYFKDIVDIYSLIETTLEHDPGVATATADTLPTVALHM